MNDILFLLAADFKGNDRREFCPECAEIWGVMAYFPAIKEALDIRYQDITRPRTAMVELLGEEHQNCPTLVLAGGVNSGPHAHVHEANGHRFFDNARDIANYFARRYGTPFPRGS